MAYPIAEATRYELNPDATLDATLVEQTRAHDLAAFDQLVARYQHKIIRFAAYMVDNLEEAEDVAQDVFIKVYKSLDGFRGESSFGTWLHRIAMNVCIDHLRQRKRRPHIMYSFDDSFDEPCDQPEGIGRQEISDGCAGPTRVVEQHELKWQVRQAITHLSAKHRATLVMSELQGMSHEEIARATGCSIGTVKSRLFYARADLARRLRPYLRDVT
jgi:RNA polymerase sigma-70 factor, ECF subfamily